MPYYNIIRNMHITMHCIFITNQLQCIILFNIKHKYDKTEILMVSHKAYLSYKDMFYGYQQNIISLWSYQYQRLYLILKRKYSYNCSQWMEEVHLVIIYKSIILQTIPILHIIYFIWAHFLLYTTLHERTVYKYYLMSNIKS